MLILSTFFPLFLSNIHLIVKDENFSVLRYLSFLQHPPISWLPTVLISPLNLSKIPLLHPHSPILVQC